MEFVSIGAEADGALDVALRGEIDYTNASAVLDAVCAAVRHRAPRTVRMNLADVTFLDSSGIAVLVKAMKAAREVHADYRVDGPQPRVLDQLRMTGLTELFPVEGARPAPAEAERPAPGGGARPAVADGADRSAGHRCPADGAD